MKKIYQIIMLCAIGLAFVSCGGNGSKNDPEQQSVDEFLEPLVSHGYLNSIQQGLVEGYARKSVNKGDFDAAHKCIAALKGGGCSVSELVVDVYAEEAKYLIANNAEDAMPRIKMMLAEAVPKAKPAKGGDWYDEHVEDYAKEAKHYNNLLSRIVDYLLSVDMEDEAKQIADKGLEIPVEKEHVYRNDQWVHPFGYDNSHAEEIAAKVK